MRYVAVALIVAAGSATAAQAAAPISLGRGSAPGVAIDSFGTAHVAWNAPLANGGEALTSCTLVRSARSCTPVVALTDGATPGETPALVRAGPGLGEVTILSFRPNRTRGDDAVVAVQSINDGRTFGGPSDLASAPYFEGAFGGDGTVALVDTERGVRVQRASLLGPAVLTQALVNRPTELRAKVAYVGSRRPVVVSGSPGIGVKVSVWSGAGDPNDARTWRGPRKLPTALNYDLAGGRRGVLWLREAARAGGDRLFVHRFTGTTFGRGLPVPAGRRAQVGSVALAQDAARRVVAVWFDARGWLRATASADGRRWSAPRTLATGIGPPLDLRLALGRDGRGLAVIADFATDAIRAVRIDAAALLRRRR